MSVCLSISHLSERSMWQEEGPLDRIWLLLPTCIDPTPRILVKLLLLHQIETQIRRRAEGWDRQPAPHCQALNQLNGMLTQR